jgi:voltage-gated potassium channel
MFIKSNQDFREDLKHPTIPLIILLVVFIVGVIGYMYLWRDKDAGILDAIYMVFITITTVGYGEVYPLSDAGKILAIFLMIGGVTSLLYISSIFFENLLIIQRQNLRGQRKMLKKIYKMEDHYIIVGFGRVGALAAYEMTLRKKDVLIIDKHLRENQYFVASEINGIEGDAQDDDTLKLANIHKAKGLICAVEDSAASVFIVLSARQMNPNLHIVARADQDQVGKKLLRAGANKVVNPFAAGGMKMASIASNPSVIDFFDSNMRGSKSSFDIETIELPDNCYWFGKSLIDLDLRNKAGISIIGIVRELEPIINPPGDFVFIKGDKILVIGTLDDLQTLEVLINGGSLT